MTHGVAGAGRSAARADARRGSRLRLGQVGALLAAFSLTACDDGANAPAEGSLVGSQIPIPAPLPLAAPEVATPAPPVAIAVTPVAPVATLPPAALPALAADPTPLAPVVAPPPAAIPVIPEAVAAPEPAPPAATPVPAPPQPAAAADPIPPVAAPIPSAIAAVSEPAMPGPVPVAPAPPDAPVALAVPAAAAAAAVDPALLARLIAADVEAGAALAARCGACHTLAEGGGTLVGPNLYDIVAAPVGRAEGFIYSAAVRSLGAAGATWTYERLDAFLLSPAATIVGTRMGFAGMPNEQDRANVIAFLRTLSRAPMALGAESAAQAPVRPDLGPAVFTVEQVDTGRDHYAQYCAGCHGGNLIGLYNEGVWGSAPNLIGADFAETWYGGTIYDLYRALQTNVVIEDDNRYDHGGLPDARYADLLAFILSQNGFVAGLVPMPVDRAALERIGFRQ